jgi:kojibiose phosphorylase
MYLLPDEFDAEIKRANFDYYEARTLHKSSLSPSIHAIMGIEVGDTTRAVPYFERSAFVDLSDNQGNTDEGMHIASAGGTWQILVNGFGGLRILGGRVALNPWVPDDWEGIRFRLRWRGRPIHVTVDHEHVTLRLGGPDGGTEEVIVSGKPVQLTAGTPAQVALEGTMPHTRSVHRDLSAEAGGAAESEGQPHLIKGPRRGGARPDPGRDRRGSARPPTG